MNKIVTIIHFFMISLLVIFGNNLLKFTIVGINNVPLVIYFGICLCHMILSSKNHKFKLNEAEKKVVKYLLWMVFVIVLSLFDIYKIFLSNTIYFDKHYIIKQTLFLVLIPIAISMYICFLYDKDYIEKILKKYSLIAFFIMNIFSLFGFCNQTVSYFFLLLLSFYIIKNDNLFIKIIVFILTLLYIRNIFSESTATLMLIMYLIMLIFNSKLIVFFQKKRHFLYFIIISILLLAFINTNKIVIFLEEYDVNYWWRFSYWMNEIRVLKKTLFMGVGFGSTYASTDIFKTLKGGFIDPATGNSVNTARSLFTTAQHNSYMNVLYRTGFIGLSYFLIYTFDFMFKSKKYVNSAFDSMILLAFINSNIIILFNVGLESPQFIIPYYMALTGIMSLRRTNKTD